MCGAARLALGQEPGLVILSRGVSSHQKGAGSGGALSRRRLEGSLCQTPTVAATTLPVRVWIEGRKEGVAGVADLTVDVSISETGR